MKKLLFHDFELCEEDKVNQLMNNHMWGLN